MQRGLAVVWLVLAAACSSKSEVKGGGSGSGGVPGRPTVTIFALAEVRGQIGPCGCTSDPLGDIARTTKLVAEARAAGPVVVVDAGSLLYSQSPVPPHLEAQEQLKADLLAKIYDKDLEVAALGLGPADLAKGPAEVRLPRHVVNLDPSVKITMAPPKIITAGGAKLGVFGVIASDAIPGLAITDPVAAGTAAAAKLRGDGAKVVIALVQASTKRDASKLVKDIGGIDIAILGLGQNAPEPDKTEVEADRAGDAWLVIPANRGQIVSRIDVTLRDGGPLVDAVGPLAAKAKAAQMQREIDDIELGLQKFAADKSADPAFIATKKTERDALVAKKKALEAQPLVIPAKGSYFTLAQLRINKTLACSTAVQDGVKAFDLAAGEANVKAASSIAVVPPKKGVATYIGMETCADCHDDAVQFWKKTVHAGAWKTLVDRGQQFDYDCIGCHVAGWQQPGGSTLASNDKLRDVQCETCHGPASIHVAKGGEEKPPAVRRNPPEDLCATQCHTHEHSDTFQREAYLRDIVGPGHGEDMRKKLGDGPTGHSLRTAALDRAGRNLGAGCTR